MNRWLATFARIRPFAPTGIVLVCLLVAVTAIFLARTLGPHEVVLPAGGEPRLLDNDSYFHLRQSEALIEAFPTIPRTDLAATYPETRRAQALGLFNGVLAAAGVVTAFGVPSREQLTQVAAWMPPLLAVAAALLLYSLARRLVTRSWAMAAVALFALFPGEHLERTLLGFADQHAAETVLGLALLLGVHAAQHGAGRRPALLAALPMGLMLYTWVGGALWVAVVAVALALTWLVQAACGREERTQVASSAWRYGLGVLVLAALPAALVPSLVMRPEAHVAALALAAALALGVPLAELALRRWLERGMRRGAGVTLITAAAFAVAMTATVCIPGAREVAARVLLPKPEAIAELQAASFLLLGPLALLSALAAAWLFIEFTRGRLPAASFAVNAAAVLMLVEHVVTRDYGYTAAPLAALLVSLAASHAYPRVPRWRGSRPVIAAAGLVGLCGLTWWPLGWVRAPIANAEMARSLLLADDAWLKATAWLAAHTGSKDGGVMVHWPYGSLVAALAGRVPVDSQGVSPRTSRWFVTKDEATSLDALCPKCRDGQHVGHVVLAARNLGEEFIGLSREAGIPAGHFQGVAGALKVDGAPTTIVDYGPDYRSSIAARLYLGDATDLTHYRLVYESPERMLLTYHQHAGSVIRRALAPRSSEHERELLSMANPRTVTRDGHGGVLHGGEMHAAVKVFQVVSGARIVGITTPGIPVMAVADTSVEGSGRQLRAVVRAHAGPSGRFELPTAQPGVYTIYRPQGNNAALATAAEALGRAIVTFEAVEAGHEVSLGPSL